MKKSYFTIQCHGMVLSALENGRAFAWVHKVEDGIICTDPTAAAVELVKFRRYAGEVQWAEMKKIVKVEPVELEV